MEWNDKVSSIEVQDILEFSVFGTSKLLLLDCFTL